MPSTILPLAIYSLQQTDHVIKRLLNPAKTRYIHEMDRKISPSSPSPFHLLLFILNTPHTHNPTCKHLVDSLWGCFIILHKCTSHVGNSTFATSQVLWQHLSSDCMVCVCVCVCVRVCAGLRYRLRQLYSMQNQHPTYRCNYGVFAAGLV